MKSISKSVNQGKRLCDWQVEDICLQQGLLRANRSWKPSWTPDKNRTIVTCHACIERLLEIKGVYRTTFSVPELRKTMSMCTENQNLTDSLAGLKNEILCFEIVAVVKSNKIIKIWATYKDSQYRTSGFPSRFCISQSVLLPLLVTVDFSVV